jgi:prefoldin subunit 5
MRFGGYAAPYGEPALERKPDPAAAKQMLKNQAEALQSELDLINQRLAEVDNGSVAD